MSRIGVVVCCVALAVVAIPRAASAAVSASFAMVGPNPLNATCPVNVNFTGAITAPAGTAVTYTYSHFVNGASVISAPVKDTIPANGSLAIAETLPIDQAHSGFQSNEVDVSSPNAAQGKVFFTVNCLTITPGGPSPGGPSRLNRGPSGHAYQLVYGIPIPENLKSTTDPHECGTHGGLAGLFCMQAVPDKYLILVWDWTPNDRWPFIDGYHIYDVTGGKITRVQDQTNPQATVEFFKPGSFAAHCYAVSAYKGTTESVLSAYYCASSATGLKTITIQAPANGSRHKEYALGGPAYTGDCDNPCIGYTFDKVVVLGVVQSHDNLVRRGYYTFYPRGVMIRGLNVAKATLSVMRLHPELPPSRRINSFECFGALGAAKTDWIASSAFADGDFGYDVPASIGTNSATFDVTRIVRDWANGVIPIYGFVFKGLDENTGSDANDSCELLLQPDATLTIQYY